jgi:exosortase
MRRQPISSRAEAALLVAVLALAVACFHFFGNSAAVDWEGRSIFGWVSRQWLKQGGDFSHGWLMPLFSLWLIWRRRSDLAAAAKRVDGRGLAIIVASLILHWAAYRAQQARFSLIAVVGVLWGVPFYLYGPAVARILALPAAYLLLCFTSSLLFYATFHLRLLSTVLATGLLNGLGLEVIRNGTAILSGTPGGFQLDVADPCSGLRSLYVMTALAVPYAYLTVRSRRGAWILVMLSIPLAVLANVVRILSLALVAQAAGVDMAMRLYHDFSGYLMFAISILLLTAAGAAMNRLFSPSPESPADSVPAAVDPEAAPRAGGRQYGLAMALIAGTMGLLVLGAPAGFNPDTGLTSVLPDRIGAYAAVDYRYCQNASCLAAHRVSDLPAGAATCPTCGGPLDDVTLGENTLLPPGTRITRRAYEAPGQPPVHVSIVVADKEHRSIHKPQVCLVAQGYAIVDQQVAPVAPAGRRPLDVMFLNVVPQRATPADRGGSCYAYWFSSRTHETPHHAIRLLWTTWDGLVRGSRDAWAYVAVAAGGQDAESARQTTADFISALYPLLSTKAAEAR